MQVAPVISIQPTPAVEFIVEIGNTADFLAMLDMTIAEVDALVASEPDYRIWGMLQLQLHAMKAWSNTTKTNDGEKPDNISIGIIAARELEPTDQPWLQDLIDRLHLLNQHWRHSRHWPNTEAPIPQRPLKWLGKVTTALVMMTMVVVGSRLGTALDRTNTGRACNADWTADAHPRRDRNAHIVAGTLHGQPAPQAGE